MRCCQCREDGPHFATMLSAYTHAKTPSYVPPHPSTSPSLFPAFTLAGTGCWRSRLPLQCSCTGSDSLCVATPDLEHQHLKQGLPHRCVTILPPQTPPTPSFGKTRHCILRTCFRLVLVSLAFSYISMCPSLLSCVRNLISLSPYFYCFCSGSHL